MAITSINPATGETLKEFSTFNQSQIEKALCCAAEAFENHRRTPFAQRAELLMGAATLLEREKEQLAHIITLEMGKFLRASIEEIEKCARGCRFYAENAERFLEDRTDKPAPRAALFAISRSDRSRHHAMEFSFLAGVPLRRAGLDGGQCRLAQTRRQCSAMRARD